MVSFSAALFLLFPLLAVAFPCSDPVNVSQALLSSSNGQSMYEVTLDNLSPLFLRELVLLPSLSLAEAEGMTMGEYGVVFPLDFAGIPPMMTYHWTYTVTGDASVEFKTLYADCAKDAPAPAHETRKNSGHRATPAPTKAPKRATHAPTKAPEHTEAPAHTKAPEHTEAPAHTKAPVHTEAPAHTKAPVHTEAPAHTKAPAPTQAPGRVTFAPTEAPAHPTPAPSKPTTAPSKTSGSGPVQTVCSGNPRMLNGKPCASTTRYWDGNYGACGCGASQAAGAFGWIGTQYTAAASAPLFGTATWCGTGCGKCYNLTTTGFSPDGRGAAADQSITVMISNLCPPGGDWCVAAGVNSFEYGAHFDLADLNMNGIISALGWDNPEVVYEEVACTGATPNSPSTAEFDTCTCAQ